MSLIRYQSPEAGSWSRFDRWANLREELNSLFDLSGTFTNGRGPQLFSAWTPALDLYQSQDNLIACVELPGMRKEDIEISLRDGTLTISGERVTESKADNATERTERYSGKFRRSISLPTRVDSSKVTASYKDGILTVTLPKAEEAKPRQIKVKAD